MTYDRQYAEEVLGADCSHCPLRVGGRFVPSAGPDTADLAFVGEAPGIQEARSGVPFVGPSGKLLEIVSSSYGIKREEVFLSNACLCRPADGTTPPKQAIAACRPRLLGELAGRGADTVVSLGNSAALSILGTEGITRLRVGPGRQSPYPELAGVRIIPTVHPAACLRQSDMFPSLVSDVAKVVTDAEPWQEPEVGVIDDPSAAKNFLGGLLEVTKFRLLDLVTDIEVDIDKDTSFDHPNKYGQLCVGLCWDDNYAVIIGEEALKYEEVWDALDELFDNCNIVGQNLKFDLAGLSPKIGVKTPYFDTMLAHYCLDERPGTHGLKDMAIEELGAPKYDEDIKKWLNNPPAELAHYKGYGRIPRPILYKYCGYDCVATFRLKKKYERKLENKKPDWWAYHYEFKSLRFLHDFLIEASEPFTFMELNGIKIDKEYNAELWKKFQDSLAVINDEINEVLIKDGWVAINPRSPQQVMKALTEHFRCRVNNTTEDTLTLLKEACEGKYSDYESKPLYLFIVGLLKHRKEAKMFGTYVKGIRNRLYRGRVHSTFRLNGPVTGRTASRNPNVQNIPRAGLIKKQFIPASEANVFVQADYSQAELRVLCWLADEPYFRDILNDPTRDLFDELTPILYPELPPKNMVDKELWKDIRVRVKAFVYGLNYGRTEFSIAHELRLDIREAKLVKNRFFSTIPSIVAWQEWVKREVKSGHDLISPFGRHRRFHLITEENWKGIQNEALAFLPQSTSSDVGLRALARVRRDLRGSGAYLRNFVHDSILVDCPRDMADDVAVLLDQRMVESGQELVGDYIQFKTDVKIGNNWAEV
jgi:uracil-DNA glycosylase family 4